MKNIIRENFLEMILKVPIIEKCDIVKNSDKEIIIEIELQDGFSFITTIHLLKNGYPKQISELSSHLTQGVYHVVGAPFISNGAEEICKNMNIGYIDVAGNCLFQYHSLYINVLGNKNKEASKRALKSIFERTSIVSSKILREMYQDIDKVWRIKELADQCNCSVGQIAKVKDFLLKNAWIEQTSQGIQLLKTEEPLKEWARVYNNKPNEVIECYTLDSIPNLEAKLQQMKIDCGIEYYLSGFAGGVRYQPVVRYQKMHCYIEHQDLKEAMEYLQLKKVDSGANVAIMIPYDDCIFEHSRQINNSSVVDPVQIYLDCMALKGRGEEMANAIWTKEICK